MLRFRIVYEDSEMVVIDKPCNFHTHAPEDKAIRLNRKWDATSILSKQLNQKVAAVHRLDRQTSGLVIFAKNKEMAKSLSSLFLEHRIEKTYFGVACGFIHETNFSIDRMLKSPKGDLLPAFTRFERVHSFQLPIELSQMADFSILKIIPKTGRFHQIRRHLAGANTPILNDRKRGNKKLNRVVVPIMNTDQMFLRAMKLEFVHPGTQRNLVILNRWTRSWHYLFERIGFCAMANARDFTL